MARSTLLELREVPKAYDRIKRNVDLPNGGRTTYQMERIYWNVIDAACNRRQMSVGDFVVEASDRFPSSSITSSLRIAALFYATAVLPNDAPITLHGTRLIKTAHQAGLTVLTALASVLAR